MKEKIEVYLTIYHIPGIKVGVTENFKKRVIENRHKHGNKEMKILKQGIMDIDMATLLENTCNVMYGYKKGVPYNVNYLRSKKKINSDKQRAGWLKVSKEDNDRRKKKISETVLASEYLTKKLVAVNGEVYDSIRAASRATGENYNVLYSRLRSKSKKFKNYMFLDKYDGQF